MQPGTIHRVLGKQKQTIALSPTSVWCVDNHPLDVADVDLLRVRSQFNNGQKLQPTAVTTVSPRRLNLADRPYQVWRLGPHRHDSCDRAGNFRQPWGADGNPRR